MRCHTQVEKPHRQLLMTLIIDLFVLNVLTVLEVHGWINCSCPFIMLAMCSLYLEFMDGLTVVVHNATNAINTTKV